ncbi:hypothetical protein RUM43_005425 [Polyplax serrata]|uniref:Uncharacterized protein n=1 Tax=Polyplax serrata TaxID=468196 RepID=A0AAN8S8M6_POLSC
MCRDNPYKQCFHPLIRRQTFIRADEEAYEELRRRLKVTPPFQDTKTNVGFNGLAAVRVSKMIFRLKLRAASDNISQLLHLCLAHSSQSIPQLQGTPTEVIHLHSNLQKYSVNCHKDAGNVFDHPKH